MKNEADTIVRLIDARVISSMLGISLSSFHRLRSAGKVGPEPTCLGRSVRWDVQEVDDWIKAKCPDAESWQLRNN